MGNNIPNCDNCAIEINCLKEQVEFLKKAYTQNNISSIEKTKELSLKKIKLIEKTQELIKTTEMLVLLKKEYNIIKEENDRIKNGLQDMLL